jgi:hypothetical protein
MVADFALPHDGNLPPEPPQVGSYAAITMDISSKFGIPVSNIRQGPSCATRTRMLMPEAAINEHYKMA